jgi:beta-lactamase regulating signal transducer with metallopeptidase domain
MMLAVLLESAVRTLLLAVGVGLCLKILRVRSVQGQLTIWTVVLFAALSMPLLMQWTTIELPSPSSTAAWIGPPSPISVITVQTGSPASAPDSPGIDWQAVVFAGYWIVAGLLLIRLMIGLALTWRMYRGANPLRPDGANGLDVRVASIPGPVTFGRTVLLPRDCVTWNEEMRNAVLSHERAHVQRADFFVQLLAGLHRAIFWFSPLSWWLHNRLAELAELASDDAAIKQMSDPAAYAEILLDFSRDKPDYRWIGVSMARPKTVAKRVERILSQTTMLPALSRFEQTLLVLGAVPLVALAAGCTMRSHAQTTPSPAATASPGTAASPATVAVPSKPAAPPTRIRAVRSKGDNDAFAIVRSNSSSVTGNNVDAERALALRDKIQGDYIWFERDSKAYYITDPSTVQRVEEIFKPQEALGRQQAQLGEEQAKLGEQQAKLGEEQARVAVAVPDMTRDMESLQRLLATSSGKQLRQDELSHIQAGLAELQARFGELQARAGRDQALLGTKQASLGAQQANLGALQAQLGERQARLAAEASRLMQLLIDEALSNGQARPVQ